MAEFDLSRKSAALLSEAIKIGLEHSTIKAPLRDVKKIATLLARLAREDDERVIVLELPDVGYC